LGKENERLRARVAELEQMLDEQKRTADDEHRLLREEIARAQAMAIRELSTPLIPLADGVVVLPIVGTIDSSRAQQILETLLEGISSRQAEAAILDITGVRVVDTQVAQALLRAARAARLLGAQVVLTGIGAEIAQTLVHLQEGITYALGLIERSAVTA
jgi:rsbT co-antagonist protein RsbR